MHDDETYAEYSKRMQDEYDKAVAGEAGYEVLRRSVLTTGTVLILSTPNGYLVGKFSPIDEDAVEDWLRLSFHAWGGPFPALSNAKWAYWKSLTGELSTIGLEQKINEWHREHSPVIEVNDYVGDALTEDVVTIIEERKWLGNLKSSDRG
jgi:sorbitol-specific phosphotransferase system component IIC